MALDATVGGVSANSYVSQTAASAYLADRLEASAWATASSQDRDAALIMATTRLDAETYQGARVFADQRLQWPRYGVTDRDGMSYYDSDIIPETLKMATCELGLSLLNDPTQLEDSGLAEFENVRIGSMDVTPRAVTAGRLHAFVKRLIAPVLLGGWGTPIRRA